MGQGCVTFCVDEPTAAAIRKAYQDSGELAAVVELRRHFPGIADNANARLLWSTQPKAQRVVTTPDNVNALRM